MKPLRRLNFSDSFIGLLCKWRGSLYKLCYKELLGFLVSFGIVSIIYRQALNEDQKRMFEQLVKYCDKYLTMIPLSFILGFYVTIIATRWWSQCMALPWPDRLMLTIAMYIPGDDSESRLLRKTLCQNCNLMAVLVFRTISDSVRNRLKTLDDVVNAGFMTAKEKEVFESVKADLNLYWLPGLWFSHHLKEAQKQGRITDSHGAKLIMSELLEFRSRCGTLWSYDWQSIPLVYTQVVTLATYSFFAAGIFGRQSIGDTATDFQADIYFPSWTVLQLLFYMGLLKVAENMVNPYGDDDEDFDLNWLINRHAKAIHLSTDILSSQRPEMDPTILGSSIPKIDKKKHPSMKRKLSQTFSAISRGMHKNDDPIQTVSMNIGLHCGDTPDIRMAQDNPLFTDHNFDAEYNSPNDIIYPAIQHERLTHSTAAV